MAEALPSFISLISLPPKPHDPKMNFDILLKNGKIIDGTGTPWFLGDVALIGDKIAAVGNLSQASAKQVLDCTGKVISPGFVDTHVHGDLIPFLDPFHEAAIRQGITTYVVGQDGVAPAPASAEVLEYMCLYTAGFSCGKMFLDKKEKPHWQSIHEYLELVTNNCALNLACLIPNGNIRMEVMGLETRPPDGSELNQMKRLIAKSMEEGAVGISSGLDYIPSLYASTSELTEICKAMAPYGGVYVTHMKRYDAEGLLASMDDVHQIGRDANVPVHISHFNSKAELALPHLDKARKSGVDVTFDLYCYLAGSTILGMIALPQEMQKGGRTATIQRLAEKATFNELAPWFEAPRIPLENVRLSYLAHPDWKMYEGLTLKDAAKKLTGSEGPAAIGSFVCQSLVQCGLAVGCVVPHRNRDEKDIDAFMNHEGMMAGSDGIYTGDFPHPRGYGCFARYLGHHVRDAKSWGLEQAIQKLSWHGARRHGLKDRGLCNPGYAADVVVFDPTTIKDNAWYETGKQPASGMEHVFVNGKAVLLSGQRTTALPGRGLRRL